MEMVEEIQNVLVLNDEPEFSVCDDTQVSTSFFILCEQNPDNVLSKNVYECKIAGMSILNWVVRVCTVQPKIIEVQKNANVIEAIKPYLDEDSEYSVVLYANTPLLNKTHIQDLLGFVSRKHMNVCKLKKGYVLRNEYIAENDEIYSIDTYDFASNDFFEVKNYEDLAYAKDVLIKKVLSYHKNNGVYFENEQNLSIDASVELGYSSEIASGVIISNGSVVGNSNKIAKNSTITGSKLGDDVSVGIGSIIINSIIKNGAKIDAGAIIKNSVVGNDSVVGLGSKIMDSSIRDSAVIQDNVIVDNARIGVNSQIGKHSKILGVQKKVVIEEGCDIGANVLIADKSVDKYSKIPPNVVVSAKAGE